MSKLVRPSELIPNPVLSDGETIPHLTDGEYETLRASIEAHGILQPIVVAWPERVIIDGHHRWRVALDLKLEKVPVTLDETHTSDQQEEIGIQLNAARRHWTREAREKAIKKRLKRAPHRSDRDIAATLSVDGKTVAKYRAELEATAEIPHFDFRTDKAGTKRKVRTGSSKPEDRKNPAAPQQRVAPPQGEQSSGAEEAPESKGSPDVRGGGEPAPSGVGDGNRPTGAHSPLQNLGTSEQVPTSTAPAEHDAAGDPSDGDSRSASDSPVTEHSVGASTDQQEPPLFDEEGRRRRLSREEQLAVARQMGANPNARLPRRPPIPRLMEFVRAAVDLEEPSADELDAIPANDLMLEHLERAHRIIGLILSRNGRSAAA